MTKFYVFEAWGGGDEYYADTLEEAKEKAQEFCDGVRWTRRELADYKKEGVNFIAVERQELSTDWAHCRESEIVYTLTVDKHNLRRIY